jgi:dienelactone hydrolase
MKTELITYAMGSLAAEGALVYDENVTRKRPALLMAPNWLGMTDQAIARAKLIAGDRYVVFFAGAPALANPLRENAAEQRRRIRAAYDTLIAEGDKRGLIDNRRAAVGFCFGGGNVLELARDGADLAAAVSIHGDLKTAAPAKPGAVKAALLVTHGAPDPVVPKADRDAFEAEMDAAGAKWEMLVFSGVLHAYTDEGVVVPGIAAWHEPSTRQTYALTHQFIADAFAGTL